MKISTLLLLLSSFLLTVLFAKQVRADCTRWHPHHCAQERLENTPFDPNTWNPVDWVNSGAGELCETNALATAQRNVDIEQGLHPIQKEYLRPYFGNLVDEVTVKWGSLLNDEWTFQGRTVQVGSAGQTYGNTIYIAEKRQPRSTLQLVLLAHELGHVQQYRQRGNLDNFCREYMTAYAKAGLEYEDNPFEVEADNIAYSFARELEDKLPRSGYTYNVPFNRNIRRESIALPTELPGESGIVSAGLYQKPDGTFISANDSGAFCSFVNQAHFEFLDGNYDSVQPIDTNSISKMNDDGACAVLLPPGVYRLADGRIINSNGKAFCRYTSYEHYERADGRPIKNLADGIPLFAMENHYNCPRFE